MGAVKYDDMTDEEKIAFKTAVATSVAMTFEVNTEDVPDKDSFETAMLSAFMLLGIAANRYSRAHDVTILESTKAVLARLNDRIMPNGKPPVGMEEYLNLRATDLEHDRSLN